MKHQWDAIHHPSLVIGMFERDEDGKLIRLTLEKPALLELGITETGTRVFLTPSGKPFTLPSNINTLQFITSQPQLNIPDGALVAFKDGEELYVANYSGTKFEGYINEEDNKDLYKDLGNNYTQGYKVILGYKSIKDCFLDVKFGQLSKAFNETDNSRKGSIASILPVTAITAYKEFSDPSACYTGKAKAFKDYCKGYFDASQIINIDKVAAQIQFMAERYDDYEKVAISNNLYNTWVNTPEHLVAFTTALLNYYEAHKNSTRVDNPNCPDCPKYPIVGDVYWDNAGRNWVFWEGSKWKDLSGEFCEDEGCNNAWKNGIDVQAIHKAYYDEKLRLLENDIWQRSLGINEEFKKNLWRASQFATVHFLKENWTAEQVGDSWWNLLFGNAKSAFYKVQVANGDQTFYASAALDGVFGAVDVFLLESIAKNLVWKFGIKYLIIEGGAKQLTSQVYYTACKQVITYRLAYTLRFGTPEATAFFEKQLAKTVEIYDNAAERYIKLDPATGEVLSGKFVAGEGQSITYESFGKISTPSGLAEAEQVNYVIEKIATILPQEWTIKFELSWKSGRVIKGNINNPIGVIGSYNKDIKQLILEMGYKETPDIYYSQNGIKVLNAPQRVYLNGEQFWLEYNEKYLKGITDAKADIAVLSDPKDDLLKYIWKNDALTGQPIFDLDPLTNQKIKTGFGKEIEYMENLILQGKYQWDEIDGVYKYIGN